MRNCQICNNGWKNVIMHDYDGQNLSLYECTECGHRYVDGLVDQKWFDEFYLTRYTTNDKELSGARLDSLAALVASYAPKVVLDIGGMDGELIAKLKSKKVRAHPVGVGDKTNDKYYDGIILSHTLEHIYDIAAMFDRIHSTIKPNGLLFIEIPIHLYDNYAPAQDYDYHWQHVNKFRPRDIEALVLKHGFTLEVSEQIEDYWEYKVWRIVGRYG
jgi:Methyltransferase domain